MKIESFINRNILKSMAIVVVFVFAIFMTKSAHASAVVCFETQPGATQLNQIWGYKSTNGSCAVPGDVQYKDVTQAPNQIIVTVSNTIGSGGETLNCTPNVPSSVSSYFTITTSSSCNNILPQSPGITYNITPSAIFTNTTQQIVPVIFNGTTNLPSGGLTLSNAASDTVTFYYQAVSSAIYGACTLSVSTIYDGTPSQTIPNTYSYTITSNNIDFDTNGTSQNMTGAINGTQYSTYYNSSNWGISGITAPSGFTFDGLDPATPGSQTCPASGGTISYVLHFNGTPTPPTPPNSPSAPTANNNAACSVITINFTTATNDTYYNIARDNTGNIITTITPSPLPAVGTAESYSETPSAGAHTYYIQGGNISGTSSWVTIGSITPVPCVVNFSNSDKVVSQVNGAAYKYASSQCIGTSTGSVATLKAGDTVTFRLNLCNDGSITATGVSVVDTMDSAHLSDPISGTLYYNSPGGNVAIGTSGTSLTKTGSGTAANPTILTFNLPDISAGTHPYITFNATLLAPTGTNAQSINRFTNTGVIRCSQPACPKNISLTDGFIVYYNGTVPTQREINP